MCFSIAAILGLESRTLTLESWLGRELTQYNFNVLFYKYFIFQVIWNLQQKFQIFTILYAIMDPSYLACITVNNHDGCATLAIVIITQLSD